MITTETFTQTKKYINGVKFGINKKHKGGDNRYHSALEHYILLKGAKVNHVINFLQDKVKTLNLS